MTIQNMFNMAKGQTLTQDGCETDVEDKRYNIGDISQKTGLQKTANGWVKPKNGKAPGAKTGPGESKPAGKHPPIVMPKGMTPAEFMKAWEDDAKKNGFKKGQGDEWREHLRNEEAKKKATESKPAGKAEWKPDESAHLSHKDHVSLAQEVKSNSLPGSDWTAEEIAKEWKLGKGDAEEVKKEFDKIKNRSHASLRSEEEKKKAGSKPAAPRNEIENVGGANRPYRIKGTQFFFNTPEEAENAILAKNRGGTTYARPSQDSTVNNIQESLGFKLDTSYGGKHSMDDFMKKTGENEYAVNVWSFGTDSKGTLINPLNETDKPNATIKKENGEWKLHYKDRDGKETVVTANGRQDPTNDCAPRVLTKDTKIRVRKA